MPKTITKKQLAEMLQMSTRNITRRNADGRLPRPMKFGRLLRWNAEEISDWIQAGAPPRDEWEAMKREAEELAAAG